MNTTLQQSVTFYWLALDIFHSENNKLKVTQFKLFSTNFSDASKASKIQNFIA